MKKREVFAAGFDAGFDEGRQDGLADGYDEGYDEGHTDGLEAALGEMDKVVEHIVCAVLSA
jgi:flagellar biosynthesis/type III secretory pathway protein FliH